MQTIAVVIPFYQRLPGILPRCIASVLAERIGPNYRFLIVVVDDESPLPLKAEMEGVVVPPPHELVCLYRSNGGPGAARNTALDCLKDRDVAFVAFIDSDDTWRPNHISRALSTLADDADFFFCDHDRWNYPSSYFDGSKTFQGWVSSADAPFYALPSETSGERAAYQFKPGEAFRCFLQDYLAQTSTVVYRYRHYPKLRFDTSLRYAGEDNMFWLQLSKAARAVRFTTEKDVVTGEGVNMFAGSIAWSHPEAARRVAAVIKFHLTIPRTLELDAQGRASIARGLARYETEFAHVLVRKAFRRPIAALAALAPLLWMKPKLAFVLPARLFGKANP